MYIDEGYSRSEISTHKVAEISAAFRSVCFTNLLPLTYNLVKLYVGNKLYSVYSSNLFLDIFKIVSVKKIRIVIKRSWGKFIRRTFIRRKF